MYAVRDQFCFGIFPGKSFSFPLKSIFVLDLDFLKSVKILNVRSIYIYIPWFVLQLPDDFGDSFQDSKGLFQ